MILGYFVPIYNICSLCWLLYEVWVSLCLLWVYFFKSTIFVFFGWLLGVEWVLLFLSLFMGCGVLMKKKCFILV